MFFPLTEEEQAKKMDGESGESIFAFIPGPRSRILADSSEASLCPLLEIELIGESWPG